MVTGPFVAPPPKRLTRLHSKVDEETAQGLRRSPMLTKYTSAPVLSKNSSDGPYFFHTGVRELQWQACQILQVEFVKQKMLHSYRKLIPEALSTSNPLGHCVIAPYRNCPFKELYAEAISTLSISNDCYCTGEGLKNIPMYRLGHPTHVLQGTPKATTLSKNLLRCNYTDGPSTRTIVWPT